MDWFIGDKQTKVDTFFASPERSSEYEIKNDINIIINNKITDFILYATGNLVAILNKNRQVLAINDNFLKYIGIENPDKILGLRPGEIIQCKHSNDMEAGCGTSKYCSSCGATIAIVTAISDNEIAERKCIIEKKDGETVCFNIKAVPYFIDDTKYIFLFMHDTTESESLMNCHKFFLHDLSNTITALGQYIEILKLESISSAVTPTMYIEILDEIYKRLTKELASQKALMHNDPGKLTLSLNKFNISYFISHLRTFFKNHPSAKNKKLEIDWNFYDREIITDEGILLRILTNMLTNAFENTEEIVKLWIEINENHIIFNLWNSKPMDEKTTMRIFQKFFTTKNEAGHGFGTFSIKFLGEKILKGEVSFTTSPAKGTTFSFKHPIFEN